MEKKTIYEAYNGQQFTSKQEAEETLVKAVISRLDGFVAKRDRCHAAKSITEKKAILLAGSDITLQRIAEQLASLLNDLTILETLE